MPETYRCYVVLRGTEYDVILTEVPDTVSGSGAAGFSKALSGIPYFNINAGQDIASLNDFMEGVRDDIRRAQLDAVAPLNILDLSFRIGKSSQYTVSWPIEGLAAALLSEDIIQAISQTRVITK